MCSLYTIGIQSFYTLLRFRGKAFSDYCRNVQLAPVRDGLMCRDNSHGHHSPVPHIGDKFFASTHAVDERANSCLGGIFFDGAAYRLARSSIGHLAARTVGGSGSNSFGYLRIGYNVDSTFGPVIEVCIFEGEVETALGAIKPKLVAHLGVVSNRAEDEATALGIAKNGLDVVIDLAAIVIDGDTASGAGGAGCFAEDPVGDIDVMRCQLREQVMRVLLVETPVDKALKRWVKDGTTPVVVAVPVGIDVGDVPISPSWTRLMPS